MFSAMDSTTEGAANLGRDLPLYGEEHFPFIPFRYGTSLGTGRFVNRWGGRCPPQPNGLCAAAHRVLSSTGWRFESPQRQLGDPQYPAFAYRWKVCGRGRAQARQVYSERFQKCDERFAILRRQMQSERMTFYSECLCAIGLEACRNVVIAHTAWVEPSFAC